MNQNKSEPVAKMSATQNEVVTKLCGQGGGCHFMNERCVWCNKPELAPAPNQLEGTELPWSVITHTDAEYKEELGAYANGVAMDDAISSDAIRELLDARSELVALRGEKERLEAKVAGVKEQDGFVQNQLHELLAKINEAGVRLDWEPIDSPNRSYAIRNARAKAAEAQLVARESAPTITMQILIDAGLNAFAFELVSESLAGKRDVKTFKRLRFEFRGVIYTLEPALVAPSDDKEQQ